jgi:hypothetical protein
MNSLAKLLSFLNRLDKAKISYSLEHNRDETIMVLVVVPGQRWEIEYFVDGSIEIETFISEGVKGDDGTLEELFSKFSE